MSTKLGLKQKIFNIDHSVASAPAKVTLRSWYGLTKNKTSTHPQKQSIQPESAQSRLSKEKQNVLLSKSMEPTFNRLANKRARDAYVAAELANSISSQIRVLRQQREWSQKDLAEKLGTTQGVVSRLEDPSYGRFSIKTLLELGSIFDVSILARFLPFSQSVQVTWDTRRESLEAESFDDDVRRVRFVSEVDSRYFASHSFPDQLVDSLRNYSEQELKNLGTDSSSSVTFKKYVAL